MDHSDYSALIGRLERTADEWPRLYRARLAAVAAAGYAIPALLALGLLVAVFCIIRALLAVGTPPLWMVLLALAQAVALMMTVRSLHVRVTEPAQLAIGREQAPALFALLDRLTARVQAASLATVTIDTELRIGLLCTARLGIFGAQRQHLQLGLPLLLALDVEELTALLARELAHTSSLGRFHAWIYRQRPLWQMVAHRLAEPAGLSERVLARFYVGYVPWFCAYSLPLARLHELHADRLAAALTTPATLAQALIKQELLGRFASQIFWPRLLAQVEKLPEPPQRPYSLMQRALRTAQKEWQRREWLAEALGRYATNDDTRPALTERLAAIEVRAQLPAGIAEPQALSVLGTAGPRLLDHCDEAWMAQNAAGWRARHDEVKEARWKIAEYERYQGAALDIQDLWAKAHLLLNVGREREAVETLQLLLARDTGYPQAHLLLGRMLLARGDERGLEHLLTAAEQDLELGSTCAALGRSYLSTRGRKGEATRFEQRINAPLTG